MVSKNILRKNSAISDENLKTLLDLLGNVKYGSITLIVQDGIVIQVERNEKIRFR